MNEVATAEEIKKLTAPILEKGFSFEYFYEKGGDSSCVYICRFRKGREFWDWREVSGGDEINLVVHAGGEVKFPPLKYLYKKEYKAFFWKHFFKKSTREDRRKFMAELLVKHLLENPDFFGVFFFGASFFLPFGL